MDTPLPLWTTTSSSTGDEGAESMTGEVVVIDRRGAQYRVADASAHKNTAEV